MLEDFYWKVIFPSITYCILVWGNCSKTHFKALERLHTRAARIIYRLNWDIPSQEVMHKTGWKTLSSTYKQRVLRADVCENRDSRDSLKNLKFCLFHQNILFRELF